jgi:hypothetical protein
MSSDAVRAIADAVLYEGYVLYPYRASAQKNRSRWQFGVLMPPGYVATDPSESTTQQAQCLLEHDGEPGVQVVVRFLQVRRRHTAGTAPSLSSALSALSALSAPSGLPDPPGPSVWDEAVEQEVTVTVPSPALLGDGALTRFSIPGGAETQSESGVRVVRRREPLAGTVTVRAAPLPGPWQAARLTVRVTNESATTAVSPEPGSRQEALPTAFVAAHMIITVSGGAFISLTDPPEWASQEAGACQNIGCWPALAAPGDNRQVMLAAPIILPDHPQVAPESPGELYDGTEIDEILTLRTLALSDEEKAAARATDPRAAALIDRVGAMDATDLERLHGTIRGLSGRAGAGDGAGLDVPWWDPGADASVSPATDAVVVGGRRIARGSRVILRPGARRADAQDMFLTGREAIVEAVLLDVDDTAYLAVTLADDPAADLHSAHGRFRYFAPDEVEPCAAGPGVGGTGGVSQ